MLVAFAQTYVRLKEIITLVGEQEYLLQAPDICILWRAY